MPLYARDMRKSDGVPAPAGLHRAVCFAVVYLGIVDSGFGPKEKIQIYWQIEEKHPEYGNPFILSKRYNLSFHEKSALYGDTESWRGKKWTEEEIEKLDIESLATDHVNCTLNVTHNVKEGSTWANVGNVNPPMKGAEKLLFEPNERTGELVTKMLGNFDRKCATLEASNPKVANETDEAAANGDFNEPDDGDTPF